MDTAVSISRPCTLLLKHVCTGADFWYEINFPCLSCLVTLSGTAVGINSEIEFSILNTRSHWNLLTRVIVLEEISVENFVSDC